MNKSAIKNYAVWARRELIDRVTRKAFEYEVSDNKELKDNLNSVNGKLFTNEEKRQRSELIREIKSKGFNQVMEEVAYTWFNRFIALRFMEVNNYLPNRIRLFTNENNEFKPQILDEAMNIELDGLSKQEIYDLYQSNNRQELYKRLLIATCNDMGNYLPGMFTKIADYKVLLFPDNLLNQDSVIGKLVTDIEEDDWYNQVEIIGWMYQYYISEKHEEVVDPLHGKTIKKSDIPAATQLFTTDWVVRYMVDNSLGRYWIERNPNSQLKEKLSFLITDKNGEMPIINERVNPEDITFLDPCMGSGHILVYAFDVLMEIYKECGYSERDAAINIVEHNLYGLDIDDRAFQLAYFALMMKARSYNRKALTCEVINNLASIQESNSISHFNYEGITNNEELNQLAEYLIQVFKDAKEIGSLVTVKDADYKELEHYIINLMKHVSEDIFALDWQNTTLPLMFKLSKQSYILSKKYTVCATNPPYMNKFEDTFKTFLNKNYKNYSSDLFSAFMYRNFDFCIKDGYSAFMTPNVWMFIKSYEKLRTYILTNKKISTLIQMAKGSFYKEATVDVCTFVLQNGNSNTKGIYLRLEDFKGDMELQKQKVLEAQVNKECGYFYETDENNFCKIPGSPIAYWFTNKIYEIFSYFSLIETYAECNNGFTTGNNDLFLRLWNEVNFNTISFNSNSIEESVESGRKWFPYNKGGFYRKWYGNNDYLINWWKNGQEIKEYGHLVPRSLKYQFQQAISWSKISSGDCSFRLKKRGTMFDVAGLSCFLTEEEDTHYFLGLLNSKIVRLFLEALSPTLNYETGQISKIPVKIDNKDVVQYTVLQNISLSQGDWDSFETSWDFTVHPLIKNKVNTISEAYSLWDIECNERFNQLKANEEELNRIFINIYALQDELNPYVEDKDVTVRKADLIRDIKSFISYAVGCIFGRYSLDVEGLAYAGGEWNSSKYTSFIPDKDNIIPICDGEYFDDDIVGRIVNFVEIVYGKETLEENLSFIANALGGKGTSREVIRNYFLNEFYKNHCKIYQNRPIYWLFDSGKKNGFKALIYLHRYQPDLIARMRTQYVFEQQSRYRNQIEMIEKRLNSDLNSSERVRLNKRLKHLKEQEEELRKYEEKVHHYADCMIDIDLDDGVKVNYEKFKDLLAKIK